VIFRNGATPVPGVYSVHSSVAFATLEPRSRETKQPRVHEEDLMRVIVLAGAVIGLFLTGPAVAAGTPARDHSGDRSVSAAASRPSTPPASPNVERPRRAFAVWVMQDGEWVEAGSVPANQFLATRSLDLTGWINGDATRLRIVPRNGGLAHVDAVTLDGVPPLVVPGSPRTELDDVDLDVMEVPPEGLELGFELAGGGTAIFELTARIEPMVIGKTPFQFPPENTHHAMGDDSAFYSYRPSSRPGRLKVDGDLATESLGEPLFVERLPCDSGHPQGATYGWVMDDGETLYVALDFTPDNTMDGEADYAAVFAKRGDELLERRVTAGDWRWGRTAFGPTNRAPYHHKTYEFALPLADLVEPGSERVRLAFAAYGTASAGANLADLLAYDSNSRTYGLLFWESDIGYDLQAQRFDDNGVAVGSPMILFNTSGSQPFCGVAADPTRSAFLAVWIDWPTARILGRRFYPDGTMDPSEFEISDIEVGDDPGPPRVEFDTVNNRYLVIWTDVRSGSQYLYGRFVGSNGVPQGAGSFPIEDSMLVDRYNPALAHNPTDGQFLAAWRNSGAVYGRRIDAATGQLVGTAFQIEPATATNLDLDVGYSGVDGSYLVSWSSSTDAYARRVQPDATVGGLQPLIAAASFAEWARVSAHPRVSRFLVAVVDEGPDQAIGRLADATTGAAAGSQHAVTPAGENPEGIGAATNSHSHGLAVGYYDIVSGTPKIVFANGLCVSGDPATTTEAGVAATIGVRLCTAPTADVVVDVESADLTEGTVAPAQLTFTTSDWFTEQFVTVTPVDDGVPDGSVTYLVNLTVDDAASADEYDGVIDAVEVTNLDVVELIFYDGFESGTTSAWN